VLIVRSPVRISFGGGGTEQPVGVVHRAEERILLVIASVLANGAGGKELLIEVVAVFEPPRRHAGRRTDRLGGVLGSLPAYVLKTGAASMVKRIPASPERQAELREDFRKNVAREGQHGVHLVNVDVSHSDAGALARGLVALRVLCDDEPDLAPR